MKLQIASSKPKLLVLLVALMAVPGQSSNDYYYNEDGGDYQGYYQEESSNLYADYADGKEQKAMGGAGGWGKTFAIGAASWFIGGKVHAKRAVAKANKKHKADQKALYTKYYQDVLTLQTQNQELQQYAALIQQQQLDTEFDLADFDGDNRVSRAEFEAYKRQYLAKHPEMADQFPSFEQFDPDHNGMVTKAEHDAFYQRAR